MLLTGASWLFAVTATTTRIGGCEAFVGTRAGRNTVTPSLGGGRKQSPISLSVVQGTKADSVLLEGKLSVLQDVVKELDARQQQLREKSEASEKDYRQKLKNLEEDLEESKALVEVDKSTIAGLRGELDEMAAKHARQLEGLERQSAWEREDESQKLSDQNENVLEALRKDYKDRIHELNVQLDRKETRVEELSTQLADAEKEASRIDEGKEAIIAELQEQIKSQQKEIEFITNSPPPLEEPKSSTEDDADARKALVAQHQQVVDDYEAKLEALLREKDELSSDLEALGARSEEQVEIATAAVRAGETREASLREKSEELSKQVQQNWLLAKLANLASERIAADNESLTEENQNLQATNDGLRYELETAQSEIEELLLETQKQPTNLLQRLRSKVRGL
jgi:chromosome segregation ATPase